MTDNLPERASNNLESEDVKWNLIRDLAVSPKTQKAIAVDYGVTPGAISMFRKRHKDSIEAYKASLPDKLNDLWVTDKAERIKSLQADVELLDDMEDVDALKLKLAIMKTIEESLGQLPPRTSINITKQVNYTIEGVDMDDI
jgi:hypothetical protein